MISPHKLTMRQYVGLVRELNSRMAQLPPLFEDSQMAGTRTFLNEEALRIFDLKATKLFQEMVANFKIVMNHVVTYFGPN